MHERPGDLDDATVLATVRQAWEIDIDAVEHLPVGFGAHHWCASRHGEPQLFVTLDRLGFRHNLASLEATYAAASMLDLDFANPNLEPWVVPIADRALSVTPWLDGQRPDALNVAATTAMLGSLHAVSPPPGLRRWAPLVGPDFADRLADDIDSPWDTGPLGNEARTAIAARLGAIRDWVSTYHQLAETARSRPWVLTHGQPGTHNQLRTSDGLRLIDWESMMIAPAERDLCTVNAGDDLMNEMFVLEWRLDEINIGAIWFQATHQGTTDDRETLANLRQELGPTPGATSRPRAR